MAEDEIIAVSARISGRVQGVWFRAWTEGEAREIGLKGCVRNAPDGSVRALFVGPRRAVEEMLSRCRQGPPLARVAGVETTPVTPVPDFPDFRQKR